MSDPYKVLGVSQNATDEEIKTAYRNLAKKYHPDRYSQEPVMAELAAEKMKEINDAYDRIISERKNGSAYGGSQSYSGASSYPDVRQLIKEGRIHDAEQILNGVPIGGRNAEWYFLKGSILYSRGWLEEAYSNFSRAVQMEPGNTEYRNAFNQVTAQRGGIYGGGYRTSPGMPQDCSGCDICSSLLCADCCCECMGGDLIRCC